jgi:tetratricopeptide (TPR) repeat protein
VADYELRLSDKKVRLELVDASFSLSYDLLRPLRRKHWCRLSVFPEDFDLNGGIAVLKMARDASIEALSDLVKWSLVDFIRHLDSGEGRYRLHDLARIFAESRLESKENDDARQRHTKHYLKVLSDADDLYQKGRENILAGLMLFDREWANITEGQAWAEVMMQNVTKPKPKSDKEFALHMANSYPNNGVNVLALRQHPQESIRWLKTALIAARLMKDLNFEGWHLGNMGSAYYRLGNVRKAIKCYEKALAISREIGNRRDEETHLGNLGNAYNYLGDVRKAIEFSEQALAICREIGNRRSEGIQLCNLGNANNYLGNVRKAIEYYDQSLVISREIGDPWVEGENLINFGKAYAALGETDRAIEYYEQSLEIVRKIEDRKGESQALCNLGKAYAVLGEVLKAIDYFELSLEIARKIEYCWVEGDALFNLSLALEKLGQRPEAIDRAKAALVIFEQIESPDAEKARQKLVEWQG